MKKSWYGWLTFIGALSAAVPAAFQRVPGYMDADYYYAAALRVVSGEGLTAPFLWNYLSGAVELPAPTNAYWMPLSTWIASAGMFITGRTTFGLARIGFLLLSALVPPLTALLASRVTEQRNTAVLAGLLAAFSGFYLPYLVTTDSFSALMVLGGGYFLVMSRPITSKKAAALGILAGGIHLARAEGLLWIVLAAGALWISGQREPSPYLALLIGYLVVFGPWMGRNLLVFGDPLGPSGLQPLWLTEYNQLFIYPPEKLNFATWWASGLGEILRVRFWALKVNIGTAVVVQGGIFLVPLIIWGGIKKRKSIRVKVGVLAWVILFLTMTWIFPFQGARGAFFHAGAVLQPLFWALAALGFQELISWGTRQRRWAADQAQKILGAGFLLILIILSLLIVKQRVIGSNWRQPTWNEYHLDYQRVEEALIETGVRDNQPVMVKNPPAYYLVSQRSAVPIPYGGLKAVGLAAEQFNISYLILEKDHPDSLDGLYSHPGSDRVWELVFEIKDIRVFQHRRR